MSEINTEKIYDNLVELSEGKAIIFTYPSYDTALVGVGEVRDKTGQAKYHAIYDYQLMVQWVIEHFKICRVDAIEYIDYNTLGTSAENYPIILYRS